MNRVWLAIDAGPTLPGPLAWLSLWLGLVVAIAAAVGVVLTVRSGWRRGPGRREVLHRHLRQIVVGGQLARVEAVFGPALTVQQLDARVLRGTTVSRPMQVHSWISPDHVLRCWVTENVVHGWLVTSRTRAFQPEWHIGNMHVQLHRTYLADVGVGPTKNSMMFGANWFGYTEACRGGRALCYQSVIVGVSEANLMTEHSRLLRAIHPEDGNDAAIVAAREVTPLVSR